MPAWGFHVIDVWGGKMGEKKRGGRIGDWGGNVGQGGCSGSRWWWDEKRDEKREFGRERAWREGV